MKTTQNAHPKINPKTSLKHTQTARHLWPVLPILSSMLLASGMAMAQHQGHHGHHGHQGHSTPQPSAPATAPADTPWAEGEVRRIDAAAGKITLRHGEIRNLDMPPMSMVFTLRDKALLDSVKVGERVRFQADKLNGVYTVLALEPLP